MEPPLIPGSVCSTCGSALSDDGGCVPCLLRGGLGDTVEDEMPEVAVYGDFEVARREDGSLWALGRGGMGTTYRAIDRVLHRSVALKVIELPEAAGRAQAVRERFLREARAAAALKHVNIAGVFQFGVSNEARCCYYAMELVEGETLDARLRRDGPMGCDLALEIVMQVTAALIAAADRGLIHRDLKPGNLMLSQSHPNAEVEVKVIDFGLAKATSIKASEADLTRGAFVGTPAFASPEQFECSEVDARSDLYSLGVTFWYLLTGRVPFMGRTLEEMRDNPSRAVLPVEQLTARAVPAPVIDLLRSLLAVDPAGRPASARELMTRLKECRHLSEASHDARRFPSLEGSHPATGRFPTHRTGGRASPEESHLTELGRSDMPRPVPARWKFAAIGGLGLAAIIIGVAVWYFALRKPAALPPAIALEPTAVQSLAVKPLQNLSGDPSKGFFADGMTDELTSKLAQISALKRVVSQSAMMKYKDSTKAVGEIAREVNVQTILEGSVVLSGDQARITASLIDAATEKILWSDSFTRPVANIVQLQDSVALAIVDAVALKLTPSEHTRLTSTRVVNPEAYELYLHGTAFLRNDEADVDATIGYMERAIALDNTLAEAYAALAVGYFNKHYFFAPDDQELVAKAETAVATALKLNPDLPAGLLAEATISFGPENGFPYESVIQEVRHALALAPNFADAHFFLGVVYFHAGLVEEAGYEFRRADELWVGSPKSADIHFHLGVIALFEGHYDEAAAMCRKNEAGFVRPFVEYCIANALFDGGHLKEAREGIENARKRFPDFGGLMASMQAVISAAAGDRTQAQEKIDEALKSERGFGHFHHTLYAIAGAYAQMQQPEMACKYFALTVEKGYLNLPWFERDPMLDPIRDDPRFVALLDKMRPRYANLKRLAAEPVVIAHQ